MLKITEKGLNGMLSHELSRANLSYVRMLARDVTSNQLEEEYAGVGQAPGLEEFKGEHHYSELGEDVLTVKNKKFTGGIECPKDTVLYDKTGDIQQRMADLATGVQDHRDERIFEAILNGGSANVPCYDGKALFAADHETRKSGVQSNDISIDVVDPTKPTPLELGSVILQCIKHQIGIKDDRGRLMNKTARNFLVMVPLLFMEPALAALNSDVIQGASGTLDNVLKRQNRFSVTIEPEPQLTATDEIIVARTDGPKPILLQELRGLETHLHGPGSETWNKKKVLQYGVEVDTGVAPYWWQSILRCTLGAA